MLRSSVAFLMAIVASLLLFAIMDAMIDGDHITKGNTDSLRYIDFVRLEREVIKPPEPKKPPPKPEILKKPPPAISLAGKSFNKPKQEKLEFPDSKLDVPLNLTSPTGLSGVNLTRGKGNIEHEKNEGIVPLIRLAPVYPYKARRDGIQGWVDLEFTITTTGSVKNIKVTKSRPRRVFDKAAKKSLSRWRFKPRIENGVAIEQRASQRLTFSLDD